MKKNGLPYRKDAGFKVPENYFSDLEARLMAQITSEEKDTGLPQSSSPFKVPDSYFEDFESRLNDRLDAEKKDIKVIPLFHKKHLSYLAGVAAVLVVIISSVVFNRSQNFDYNDLDVLAVENYLLETFEYTSPEETHLLKEGDFSFATSPNSNLDREALLEYLNENMEDPSLLLNEE